MCSNLTFLQITSLHENQVKDLCSSCPHLQTLVIGELICPKNSEDVNNNLKIMNLIFSLKKVSAFKTLEKLENLFFLGRIEPKTIPLLSHSTLSGLFISDALGDDITLITTNFPNLKKFSISCSLHTPLSVKSATSLGKLPLIELSLKYKISADKLPKLFHSKNI